MWNFYANFVVEKTTDQTEFYTMQKTHIKLWEECCRILRDNLPEEQFRAWFEPIVSLSYEDGKLTLAVPSPFSSEYIENNYLSILWPTLRRVYGEGVKLFYKYNQISGQSDTAISEGGLTSSPVLSRQGHGLFQNAVAATFDSQLNPRYTFENYCSSSSNKIARAIGEAIANDPKLKTFNPLFVFGPTGVGKTHLIQAIGIKLKEHNPMARILYISARLFESQYTFASQKGKINEFINFYQSIDTLIIDDIQDIASETKVKTQNAFFHIFNHLHQNQKQIILSSDCCPTQLNGLPSRLISRFKWGMTVELEKPDLSLRRMVLQLKSEQNGLSLLPEVMDYIAENVTNSVRELEGIVVSLLAHATLLNREVTVDLARMVMNNVVKLSKKASVNFEMITQGVATHYKIDADLIFAKTRKREVSDARQMVMYMAKKYAKMSLTAIGARLSRNYATVIHGCKNIEERIAFDKQLQEDVTAIEKAIFA